MSCFYTVKHRHGWIHSGFYKTPDGKSVETFRAETPGLSLGTFKTLHGAKLAITRDWRLWCEDVKQWRKKHNNFPFYGQTI